MQLIALVAVLGIVMVSTPTALERLSEHLAKHSWDVTANQTNTVEAAAKRYIRDNLDKLKVDVSPGIPVVISQATLQTGGYLPDNFGANDAAQTYRLAVVSHPKFSGQLRAFILSSGGRPFDFKALRYISQGIAGLGGYVSEDNVAIGANGGWRIELADYGLANRAGTLVAFLPADVIGSDGLDGDRLYRFEVPGKPDLNRMHTDIDMNEHDINGAGFINAKNDIKTEDGWIVTHNDKGWINATHGGGWYMSDDKWLRSLNDKGVTTRGEMKGGTVESEGRMTANEFLRLNTVAVSGTACSSNGLVGRDGEGGILSCRAGLWSSPGNTNGYYTNLGTYVGRYDGRNNGTGTLHVYASGGASTSGGRCGNRFDLSGSVNGRNISSSTTANWDWYKNTAISIAVPAGGNFTITSYPHGCAAGKFTINAYQQS